MLILGLGKFEFLAINNICPKIINTKYLGKIEFWAQYDNVPIGQLRVYSQNAKSFGVKFELCYTQMSRFFGANIWLNNFMPKRPDFFGLSSRMNNFMPKKF